MSIFSFNVSFLTNFVCGLTKANYNFWEKSLDLKRKKNDCLTSFSLLLLCFILIFNTLVRWKIIFFIIKKKIMIIDYSIIVCFTVA